jgi:hypothetical protein
MILFEIHRVRAQAAPSAKLEDSVIVEHLLTEEFNLALRALRFPYQKQTLSEGQRNVLVRAMSGPLKPSSDDELSDCDLLVNLGLFTRTFVELQTSTFEYASPALLHIVRNDLLSAETRPVDPPKDLVTFVVNSLHLIKV